VITYVLRLQTRHIHYHRNWTQWVHHWASANNCEQPNADNYYYIIINCTMTNHQLHHVRWNKWQLVESVSC